MGTAFAWSPDVVSLLTHWALPFLVGLGVLVAFHEMGHFLAAPWVGVKVLKFSLGFGPKIFGRQIGETEYLLSVVPLGGYVKHFGEDGHETLTPEDKKRGCVHQSLWGAACSVNLKLLMGSPFVFPPGTYLERTSRSAARDAAPRGVAAQPGSGNLT